MCNHKKSGVMEMIPRKAIWLLISLLAMTALSSISPIAEAPDGSLSGEIGVEVGDWGNYDSSLLFYESNIPGYETPPIELEAIESIKWFTFEMIEVTGNN